jgi:chemotaxis regulatin CheY-phosphate phosphatase CheZ
MQLCEASRPLSKVLIINDHYMWTNDFLKKIRVQVGPLTRELHKVLKDFGMDCGIAQGKGKIYDFAFVDQEVIREVN